jgi:hypothetical protein
MRPLFLFCRFSGASTQYLYDKTFDMNLFGLPYGKRMKTISSWLPVRPMKAAIIILSLGIAICLGLLAYQQHTYSALYERQTQAIALFQRQYQTSLRENQALRAKGEIQARSQIALSQAQTIAARYRKIFEVQNRTPR